MINFTEPFITEKEKQYVADALDNKLLSGDKKYTKLCTEWFNNYGYKNFLLTTSGSSALELAALLTKIQPGDEFITPSFTFSSTANAFMLRGARPIFAVIDPDTMNIDVDKIASLITPKTKVIVPVDYAGVSCDMDKIVEIAKRHNLLVVEDAAQAVGSKYKGQICGLKADVACFSFHETKNFVMGEGGAVYIKDDQMMEEAEIIREKGTNRKQFIHGQVDKYSWHMVGSSILPSDVLAAILYGQLENFNQNRGRRLNIWQQYFDALKPLEDLGILRVPHVPEYAEHNAHIFFIFLKDAETRNSLLKFLKEREIVATFHYMPLHNSPLGQKYGYKTGDLPITEEYADRLLRLPLHCSMSDSDVETVCNAIKEFLGAVDGERQ